MRAVLATSGGLPGAAVLERLRAAPAIEIVGVVRSTRILSARYGRLRGAWAQLRRSGLRYGAYLACATFPRMDAQGLPLLETRDLNDAGARAFLARLAPQLLVSAFFNQRIGAEVVALAGAGAVNIHPSLLPEYRGVDPVFYARLRAAARLGVTVHRVAPELDRGAILAQAPLALRPEESVLAATVRLYAHGAGLLAQNLERIAAGDPGAPQAAEGGYDSWPTAAQVAALRARGVRLAAWRDLRLRGA